MGYVAIASALAVPIYLINARSPVIFQGLGLSVGLLFIGITLFSLPSVFVRDIELGEQPKYLIRRISSSKKMIKIISGEAHYKIFDNKEILDSLKMAKEKKVSIEMICGPDLVVNDEEFEKYKNAPSKYRKEFLSLAKDGTIKLYKSKERQKSHFTMIDLDYVYEESPHKQAAERRNAKIIENSLWEANRLNELFESEKPRCTPINEKNIAEFKFISEREMKARS
jgi:hypothetical protein